jgi:FKBP-type peptidyl-prolyl cis-trans isomerase
LHAFGDQAIQPETGDYLTLSLSYLNGKDSVFFHGNRTLHLEESTDNDLFTLFLNRINLGDSLSLLLPPGNFFHKTLKREVPDFLREEEYMKINLKLLSIQTEKEFETEKTLFLEWLDEYKLSERERIEKYINDSGMKEVVFEDGYYHLNLKKGTGPAIKQGRHVFMHYEGRFLKGKFFEGTKRQKDPVDFIYGTEMFLIEGLHKALANMREGDKSLVILPSEIAYCAKGSYTGIVPHYSIIVYEVEIINVE